ncbi:hypothetical protein ACONUD_04720 [Microbulbifer harenosus]|uniref:Helix-turn-helix domain-containing protein n=1 Tax=Microbulbifer harenosus TaxID=2576840 RepID=A0ABY2UJW5_9GAMM|nr:hypothetical protein [Microbulbifer harenosus]TLM78564.1 hypothetical protein FDY93_04660 [Microbulbifer harenosus]
MRIPFKSTAIAAALMGIVSVPLAWSDDDVPSADTEVVEMANSVPGDQIAGYFNDFFGGEEYSKSVVAGLRDGSIHYVEPLPESTEETVPEGAETETGELPELEDGAEDHVGMGYGNVLITMALAEELAAASAAAALEGEVGLTADESLNEVLRMRQIEGMGWGQIAKDLGVNLGEVISGIRSNRPEKMDQVASVDAKRTMRADARAEKHGKSTIERGPKVERVAKVERPVKPERVEKAERPEKPQRPERPGK